jgi:hypothetical protein
MLNRDAKSHPIQTQTLRNINSPVSPANVQKPDIAAQMPQAKSLQAEIFMPRSGRHEPATPMRSPRWRAQVVRHLSHRMARGGGDRGGAGPRWSPSCSPNGRSTPTFSISSHRGGAGVAPEPKEDLKPGLKVFAGAPKLPDGSLDVAAV